MTTSVTIVPAGASLPTAAQNELQPTTVADAGEAPPQPSDETGVQQAPSDSEQDLAAESRSLRAALLYTAAAAESPANAAKEPIADASASEPNNAALSQRQAAAVPQKGAKPAGRTGTPPPPPLVQLPNVPVKINHIKGLERGPLTDVNAIVLHRTAGSRLDLTTPSTSRLGTHFYIDKNGDIYQTASLDKYTAHVGNIRSKCIEEGTCSKQDLQAAQGIKGVAALSRFEQKKAYGDRYPMNSDSVGIEIVGKYDSRTKTWDAPTEAQTKALDQLVDALKTQYNLTNSDIYQHDKISYKTAGEGAGLGY